MKTKTTSSNLFIELVEGELFWLFSFVWIWAGSLPIGMLYIEKKINVITMILLLTAPFIFLILLAILIIINKISSNNNKK